MLLLQSIRSTCTNLAPLDRSSPDDGLPRAIPQLPDSIMEMFSMKGKTTIVTGGSGGIGFAAAEAIAEAGGDVALVYNSAKGMDERAEELSKKFGTKVKAYKCPVSEYEAVAKLVQDVKSEFGRVDCFIANVSFCNFSVSLLSHLIEQLCYF